MKLLILSDSHGYRSGMERAVETEKPDWIIHLGDFASDAQWLREQYPSIRFCSVPGNCDRDPVTPAVQLHRFGKLSVLVTHGHTLGVKYDLQRLYYSAAESGASLALFGHTHCRHLERFGDVVLFNPGTCGGSGATYGVVEIFDDGRFDCHPIDL